MPKLVFSGSTNKFLTLKSTAAVFELKPFGCRLLSAAVKTQAPSDISCLCYRQDKEVIMEKCALQITWGFLTHRKLCSISSDIQISKSYHMYSCTIQTTKGYSHTSPATANSIWS